MTSHLSAEVAARHFLNVLRRRQKYHFHDRVLMEAENLRRVGREFKDELAGTLVVATTHTQAR